MKLPFPKYVKPKKVKKRVKRPKLKSISSLKRKAWKVFSEWVRRRDADKEGFVHCITCQTYYHWKSGHAGHYLHGHNNPSFLDPQNVHFQCLKCNHFLSGNLLEYHKYMLKQYGAETIVRLENLKHQTWKPTREELTEIHDKYKRLLEELNGQARPQGGEADYVDVHLVTGEGQGDLPNCPKLAEQ